MVAFADLHISPDLEDDGAGQLPIPGDMLAAMLAHIEAGYPNEACGLLAGRDGRVTKDFPTANASATPRGFSEIAPEDLIAIWDELEANNWEFFAYYHSHPRSPAYPSPHDIYWSQNWPGTYYIIFSLAGRDHPVVRAFLISGETIAEYRIVVES